MLDFCPQDLGAKETGRAAQCNASSLSLKEAARFFTDATPKNFQSHYNKFVSAFPKEAKIISNLRPSGVGPGEMVAWFLYDNITVGGANASCDLSVGGRDFAEMKGGAYCKQHHCLQDFKLSKDHDPSVKYVVGALGAGPSAVTIDLNGKVFDSVGNVLCSYNSPNFQEQVGRIIAANVENAVDISCRDQIVERWKNMIFSEYVSGKTMAIIHTKDLKMQFFGQLTKDMVGLYRIHRNQPWARVYLPTAEVNE